MQALDIAAEMDCSREPEVSDCGIPDQQNHLLFTDARAGFVILVTNSRNYNITCCKVHSSDILFFLPKIRKATSVVLFYVVVAMISPGQHFCLSEKPETPGSDSMFPNSW